MMVILNPNSLKTGQLVVASWYDMGWRHAGGRVENFLPAKPEPKPDKKSKTPPPEPEDLAARVQLRLYPSTGSLEDVNLLLLGRDLVGPRRMTYELTEPTARDLQAIEEKITKAEQRALSVASAPKRELPEKLKTVRLERKQQRDAEDSHHQVTVINKKAEFSGKRMKAFQALKTGMSVGEAKATIDAIFGYTAGKIVLAALVAAKAIRIEARKGKAK